MNLLYSVTPASGTCVNLILPTDADDTLVTEDEDQILFNKTLNSPEFTGISSGIVQSASQYCFKAYFSSGGSNITGDGTNAPLLYNALDYQVGTGFSTTTGTFTAPINGIYHFISNIQTTGWTTSNTEVQAAFVHNAAVYNMQMTSNISYGGQYLVNSFSNSFKMAAGDTISVTLQVNGEASGTKNITLATGVNNTYLVGNLLVALG